jgi:hypothetical protein
LFVSGAQLTFPDDAQTPVSAEIDFSSPVADGQLHASLDWRRTADEEWAITVRTADGQEVQLADGGARLLVEGAEQVGHGIGEYAGIYARFVQLIDERRSDVDVAPLRLVADCLLIGSRGTVEWNPSD